MLKVIGTCPAPAQGSSDITSLYTAKFGAPVVGEQIFVGAQLMVSGFLSQPSVFTPWFRLPERSPGALSFHRLVSYLSSGGTQAQTWL